MFQVDLERLIAIAGRAKRPQRRPRTFAQVEAGLPITRDEVIETLRRVRGTEASAAEIRTLLRRLMRAMPRAGFHLRRRVWALTPEEMWRAALTLERNAQNAAMTPEETAEAVLLIQAGGPMERRRWVRLRHAFSQGHIIWGIAGHGLDDPTEHQAAALFAEDARYLARLAAPEMDAPALVALVQAERDDCAHDEPFDRANGDCPQDVLAEQLPNADFETMLTCLRNLSPEALVREALALRQPDPNYWVIV